MASSPNRRYLTDWLLQRLKTELKADVMSAPTDGGWSDDPRQVNAFYEPYCVLTPLAGDPDSRDVSDRGHEWNLPYSLQSYGTSAFQVEDQADTARRIVHETSREIVDLGGVSWRVMDVQSNSIGAVDINRNIEPPELSQRDVVMVRITRRST